MLYEVITPAAVKDDFGFVTNVTERRQVLEETCYQCHPGRRTDCLRGAMANGGMLCQDCHGDMTQVGNDFTRNVSPSNPGAFELGGDFYTNADQPRVPWANEPSCGSCHTGDVITSYSIHYTKLYEGDADAFGDLAQGGRVATAVQVAADKGEGFVLCGGQHGGSHNIPVA